MAQEDTTFKGKIGLSEKDSIPHWPSFPKAPKGAPNIVVILLDDVGFSAPSTAGGPARTPVLDQLAAQGLRYNQFHTTALCSPTRAALLSGRNEHNAGFGTVTESAMGFPGYNGIWKKDVVSVAEVLRRNGYSTAAFGKWHNTPYWEISPVGPFDRWPTNLGFEYFYGMMAGATSQWEPPLYRNTTPVEQSKTAAQGYQFTADITDEAIHWIHTHEALAPDKPYFLYFATGAAHEPHHVPQEWIAKYKGQFDQGWDKLREEIFARQKKMGIIPPGADLTPRPKELPAWESLSADEKKLFARQMEVFAAFLSYTDHELQRLLQAAQKNDNTLILYITGDNGGSGEGGIRGRDVGSLDSKPTPVQERLQHIDELGSNLYLNHYSAGWAWATATPFQWMKQVASHFGGTTNLMVVSWPARIKDHGGIRSQFAYVSDVAATLYEVTGIEFPAIVDGVKQKPLDGVSFAYSFDEPNSPSRHKTQIFEQMGNRAMYKDGWIASARHSIPWDFHRSNDFSKDRWELYNIAEDYSQAHDLSEKYPEKLKELQTLFDTEAKKNNIYPLSNSFGERAFGGGQPLLLAGIREFVFDSGLPRMPAGQAPDFLQSHRISADVLIPEGGAQGIIMSNGGRQGGFALYLKDGRLIYENNFRGRTRDILKSTTLLPQGRVRLAYEFIRDEGNPKSGTGRLYINDKLVGEAHLVHFEPPTFTSETQTFNIGKSSSSTVSQAYQPPFNFSGTLERVLVELR